jgi:hypothetical protein
MSYNNELSNPNAKNIWIENKTNHWDLQAWKNRKKEAHKDEKIFNDPRLKELAKPLGKKNRPAPAIPPIKVSITKTPPPFHSKQMNKLWKECLKKTQTDAMRDPPSLSNVKSVK